jgi:amino acid transporter
MAVAEGSLRSRFLARRHSALLVAIIVAFAVRPLIGDSSIGPIVFSLAFLGVMLVGLYTVQVDELIGDRAVLVAQRRRRRIVGWTLAVLAIVERLSAIFSPTRRMLVVGSIGWLLFFAFVTFSELRSVLRHKEVTGETISMSVSVYLLLGLTWALLYILLFQLDPKAFSFGTTATPTFAQSSNEPQAFPIFIYFSLTTLATIGYGDITPVSLQARYAAVAEGIAGQFYLTILVARLVGMHISSAADRASADRSPGRRASDSMDRDG